MPGSAYDSEMNEERHRPSHVGRWGLWMAAAFLLYLLSFGPTEVLLDHNSKWRLMSFEMQHRVYAPLWWLMPRSKICFDVITTYCRWCEIVMDEHPECHWSWHFLRIQEGLENGPSVPPPAAP